MCGRKYWHRLASAPRPTIPLAHIKTDVHSFPWESQNGDWYSHLTGIPIFPPPPPPCFNWQPCSCEEPTHLSIKLDLVSFLFLFLLPLLKIHISHKIKSLPCLCVECVCLLPFSFSFRCLKNFQQLQLVKIFSQAVSVLSRACQTAAFDSDYNTWEYLQYVDLCLSWDCHFITSLSRHMDSVYFPPPGGVNLVQGQAATPREQRYKMKPNRLGPCKWFYLQGAILLRTDMIRRCGRDR